MGVVLINFLCFVVVRGFCKQPEEQTVRLKIHHGGMFIYKPSVTPSTPYIYVLIKGK